MFFDESLWGNVVAGPCDLLALVLGELFDGGHARICENALHAIGGSVGKWCWHDGVCWEVAVAMFPTLSEAVSESGHLPTCRLIELMMLS